jgi:uncharacterized protein (DUF1501 family)
MSQECNGPTRRGLFQSLATLVAAGSTEKFTEQRAHAQTRRPSAAGDRVLVAIYLIGGNDSNNMFVPLDAEQYQTYAQARGSLAINAGDLLGVTASRSQQQFGFHPALSGLRSLFASKNLAVISNVGALERPMNKSIGLAGAIMPRDFGQHTDLSMAYLPEGHMVPGWPARAAGLSVSALHHRSLSFDSGLTAIHPDSAMDGQVVRQGMRGTALRTQFPNTPLGLELQQAAQLIGFGSTAGLGRQILTATLSGFDTHVGQSSRQSQLFGALDAAMSAFYEATVEMGMADRVTTFTLSEFNRTLAVNSNNGTNHGWGGHQLVLGGSVVGGDVHGAFPSLALGGPDDLRRSGVWIPTTSRDQYEATLASWFGANTGQLVDCFPSLTAFPVSTLEFLA